MPLSSAQADRSVNKLCTNILGSEFTFIPDDDLYIRNALECSLDPVAKRLEASEHPTIKIGNKEYSYRWRHDISRKLHQL